MWTCSKCHESVEDQFDVCWNCGTPKGGVDAGLDAVTDETRANPIACPRCEQPLDYVGTKRFHEGTNWGILGELGELFVKRERLDVYVCPRCGRVEFFVDGIGEQYRPH